VTLIGKAYQVGRNTKASRFMRSMAKRMMRTYRKIAKVVSRTDGAK